MHPDETAQVSGPHAGRSHGSQGCEGTRPHGAGLGWEALLPPNSHASLPASRLLSGQRADRWLVWGEAHCSRTWACCKKGAMLSVSSPVWPRPGAPAVALRPAGVLSERKALVSVHWEVVQFAFAFAFLKLSRNSQKTDTTIL